MRIFPPGLVRQPLTDIVPTPFVGLPSVDVEAITFVPPSHSFAMKMPELAFVSCTVTVPKAHQVPVVPCATDGPSYQRVVLRSGTLLTSELVSTPAEIVA